MRNESILNRQRETKTAWLQVRLRKLTVGLFIVRLIELRLGTVEFADQAYPFPWRTTAASATVGYADRLPSPGALPVFRCAPLKTG